MKSRFKSLTKRRNRRSGQGIVEYASMLAFVAVLAALVFAFAPGKLTPAISAAFSVVVSQLNGLAGAASSGS